MKKENIVSFASFALLTVCFSFSSAFAGGSPVAPPSDFDGDGKTDISIYRPSNGQWWVQRSLDGSHYVITFGLSTDRIVSGDYTGDDKADIAIYRPSGGEWYILRSEDFSYYAFQFGVDTDIPVPADYDGDSKADPAVFRPSTATWFILKSLGGIEITTFGLPNDIPVNADYDGDGRSDIAIRRSTQWWIQRSSDGGVYAVAHSSSDPPSDVSVPGDYTGDGLADPAYFNTINNREWVYRRSDGSIGVVSNYPAGYVPVPGDYNGDQIIDRAIFNPSTGNWRISNSGGGFVTTNFGSNGDIPIPNAFVR